MLACRERDIEDVKMMITVSGDMIRLPVISAKIKNLSEILQNDSFKAWKNLIAENIKVKQ